MAGVLQQAIQKQPPAEQPPAQNEMQQGGEQDGQGEESNVTPEEQALYDKFIDNAMNVIYADATSAQIIETVRSAQSPVEGVAQAAVTIVDQLYQKAQQQNVPIPDEILTNAADEIIHMVAEVAEAGKAIASFTDDDEFMAETRAIEIWRERHPEMVDLEQEKKDFENLDPELIKQTVSKLGV